MKKDEIPVEEISDYLMTLKHDDVDPPEEFTVEYVQVEEGVKLRCFYYKPENPVGHIVLVPGLNTLVMSWYKFLIMLMKEGYRITYIESREKRSSIMDDPKNVSQQQFVDELVSAVNQLVEGNDYIIVGSSNGSNTISIAMSQGKLQPKKAVLISPYTSFKIPFVIKLFLPIVYPKTWKYLLAPLLTVVMVPLIANKKKDPFQAHKYAMGLKLLSPLKFKWTLKRLKGKTLWEHLEKINGEGTEIYFVGAGTDPLHGAEATRKCSEIVKGSHFIELETNYDAHDRPMVELLNKINSGMSLNT